MEIDYAAVHRNAAAVLGAAHRRLRAGSWTPTRAERVMAANILAAARPARAVATPSVSILRGPARLARWAPLIRLAHSVDPGPDPAQDSTTILSSVLAAAYPLARHVEKCPAQPFPVTDGTPGAAAPTIAEVEILLETGPDSIFDLLGHVAAPLLPHPDSIERRLQQPSAPPIRERQVMASSNS